MFPLCKDSSSPITSLLSLLYTSFTNKFYNKSYHTYRIYTVAMKWSIQDILRKTDLFSKVTHTLGKLYYTSKLTYVQQNSGLIIRVWRFNSALWSSFIQWHKMWSGFRDLLYILARGEMMACWLFSKQLWHLPVDQGKNQIIQKSFNYTLTPLKGGRGGGGRKGSKAKFSLA